MHTPVLLKESIEALNIQEGGRYIDATYGLGGHSQEIAQAGGLVLGLDWDPENVQKNIKRGLPKNVKLIYGNYGNIKDIAQNNNWAPCKGVIFDLGLSMDQIRLSQRGFSYEARAEPLDMRIDTSLEESAADIINSSTREDLYDIFTQNAEEINSRSIAQAIYSTRRMKPVETVGDLLDAISKVSRNRSTIARIFQALRIEVNNEFENIRQGLQGAYEILEEGGRIVMITFHSSEDRIVKAYARDMGVKMTTIKSRQNSRMIEVQLSQL
jgi:16S rRNA (cytosine1402-N4)-methyltransferase